MKKILHIGVLSIIWILIGDAQEFRNTATSGFVFLELPVTARNASLSEATIALSDAKAGGLFVNPAAIGFMNVSHSLSVSYAPWFADIKHYGTAYAFSTPIGNFGITGILLNYGTMTRTYNTGNARSFVEAGTFSANAASVGVTYSTAMTDRFAFGVGFKYVNESIAEYRASNIVFDGGMLYYTGFHSLRVGASMLNFGTNAKFINDVFRMPTSLRLGIAGELMGDMDSEFRVTGMIEALHPNDGKEHLNAGFEACWNKMISLRGGYKFFYDEEGLNFGVGVNANAFVPVEFDIAVSQYGRLGSIVRLTFQSEL